MIASSTILDSVMKGGEWIAALRNWVQWKKMNGSRVTWGSNADVLEPPMTIGEVEEAAGHAAAAERERCIALMLSVCDHKEHSPGCTWCIMARKILER